MIIEIGPGKLVTTASALLQSQDAEEEDGASTSAVIDNLSPSTTNHGLILKQEARKYALTAPFPKGNHIISNDQSFIVQYEVRLQDGLTCGGAYIKLYEGVQGFSAYGITSASPYVIMFGPDKCGTTDKVHFIIRWRNPINGVNEEKHLTNPPRTKSDTLTHVYTLIIRPDDTFAIKIDNEVQREGSLRSDADFSPAILPSKIIDDPTDSKPDDWVDEAEIPDPTATKPDDWDEDAPATIPDDDAVKPAGWLEDEADFIIDPTAIKPEGWDEEEDGEWIAPEVPNPKCDVAPGCGEWIRPMKKNPAYKGKWSAPLIPNPAYKGEWKAKQIDNPNYFEDNALYKLGNKPISAVGIEIWTMNGNILFDNFLVCTNEEEASEYATNTWHPKYMIEYKAAQAEARRQARIARETAALEGGLMEKLAYYMGEILETAQDNPMASIATLVVTAVTLSITCYMACASDPEPETPNFAFMQQNSTEEQMAYRKQAEEAKERFRIREEMQRKYEEETNKALNAFNNANNDEADSDEDEDDEKAPLVTKEMISEIPKAPTNKPTAPKETEPEQDTVTPPVSHSAKKSVPQKQTPKKEEPKKEEPKKEEETISPPVSQKKPVVKETPKQEEKSETTPPVSQKKSAPAKETPKKEESKPAPKVVEEKKEVTKSNKEKEENPIIKPNPEPVSSPTVPSVVAKETVAEITSTSSSTAPVIIASPEPAPAPTPAPVETLPSSEPQTGGSTEEQNDGSNENIGSPEKKTTARRRATRKD